MASSTAASFLTGFRASLAARFAAAGPTLNTVGVDLLPTGDASTVERVALVAGPIQGTQTYKAFSRREDSFRIPGEFQTYSTGTDTDVVFQAAMDRAALILDEIIFEIRDNKPAVGVTTLSALVVDTTYTPFVPDGGGWRVLCTFAIDYQALVA